MDDFRGAMALFLFGVLAFHLAANLWWLHRDVHMITGAERRWIEASRELYRILAEDNGREVTTRISSALRYITGTSIQAPLLPVAAALFALPFGYSLDTLTVVNTVAFLLLITGVYFLGRRFLAPWAAWYGALIASLVPLLYATSRYFFPQLLATSLLVWFYYAVARSEGWHRSTWSVAAGILAALALLADGAMIFYLVPAALANALIGAAWFGGPQASTFFEWSKAVKLLLNAAMAAAIAATAAYGWYQNHPMLPPAGELPQVAAMAEEAAEASAMLTPLETGEAADEDVPGPFWQALAAHPWTHYGIAISNNALFPLLLLLAVPGLILAIAHPRFRGFTSLLLVGWVVGALIRLMIQGAPVAALFPALPAIAIAGALCAMAPPTQNFRVVAMSALAALLLFAFGNLTLAAYGPIARPSVDFNAAGLPLPSLAAYSDSVGIEGAPMPFGPPVTENPRHRLFSILREAEYENQTNDPYANFLQLNIDGLDFLQEQYWPPPNPILSRSLNPEEVPRRRFFHLGSGDRPEALSSRTQDADYIVFALAAGNERQEKAWIDSLAQAGFVLFERFEMNDENGKPNVYGVMARDAASPRRLAVKSMGELDQLTLFELLHLLRSPIYGQLTPDLQAYAPQRFDAILATLPAPQPLSEEVAYVAVEVARTGTNTYRFRFLFRVQQPLVQNWDISFRGRVEDEYLHYLPEEMRVQGHMDWSFTPVPATSIWPADEYHIVSHVITAQPIPYRFLLGLYTREAGFYGVTADIGELDLGALP
jgi:hypothetical protein